MKTSGTQFQALSNTDVAKAKGEISTIELNIQKKIIQSEVLSKYIRSEKNKISLETPLSYTCRQYSYDTKGIRRIAPRKGGFIKGHMSIGRRRSLSKLVCVFMPFFFMLSNIFQFQFNFFRRKQRYYLIPLCRIRLDNSYTPQRPT